LGGWDNASYVTSDGERHTAAVTVLKTETGELVRLFEGHDDNIYAVAFSPDGKMLASAGLDGTVKLWSMETGEPIGVIDEAPDYQTIGVTFKVDDESYLEELKNCLQKYITRYDLEMVEFDKQLRKTQTTQWWDGYFSFGLSKKYYDIVRIRAELKKEKYVTRVSVNLNPSGYIVWDLDFSPDGEMIAFTLSYQPMTHKVIVYSIARQQIIKTIEQDDVAHQPGVYDILFTSKENLLLILGKGDYEREPDDPLEYEGIQDTVDIYETKGFQLINRIIHPHGIIKSFTLSPEHNILVTGTEPNCHVRFFDVKSGKMFLGPFRGHMHHVNGIDFNPVHGKTMVSGGGGVLFLWDYEKIYQKYQEWLLKKLEEK
ncbi:MAG: hypothetical protein AAB019_04595, partial [Planctomycetota bacterium]